MAALSDIERAQEPKRDRVASTIDSSFRTGGSSIGPSRTSKSGHFKVAVDPSVLELMTAGDDNPNEADERHADPLFGSCCDLVKVCLIVDTIYIVQKIQVIITILLGLSIIDPDDLDLREYDDDQVRSEVVRMDSMYIILLLKEGLGIPFGIIGVIGAYRFYKYMVLCTGIWCCADLIWSLLTHRWLSSVYVAFYIYPHFALFFALKRGRITFENYDDVKHCCCSTKQNCCRAKK